MAIVKAEKADLDQCTDILFISGLGKLYYFKKEFLRTQLEKSMYMDEIFVEKEIKDEEASTSEVKGVIWYQKEGLFHAFHYLHMIGVRSDFRQQGVGSRLMDFYEQDALRNGKSQMCTKAFLLVNDLNTDAQQFYQNRGYEKVGEFKSLFRRGITERMFMKKIVAGGVLYRPVLDWLGKTIKQYSGKIAFLTLKSI